MRRIGRVSPQEDAKMAFFSSTCGNKNAAEFKNRNALGARAYVAIEHSKKPGAQIRPECHVIFAERIAQLDRISSCNHSC